MTRYIMTEPKAALEWLDDQVSRFSGIENNPAWVIREMIKEAPPKISHNEVTVDGGALKNILNLLDGHYNWSTPEGTLREVLQSDIENMRKAIKKGKNNG